MSLRLKMLFAAAVLLVVPVAGYRYIIAMDAFLRDHQSQSALDSARTLALALDGHPELHSLRQTSNSDTLFVHPVARALQVDGYDEDWNALAIAAHQAPLALRAASDGRAMFIMLQVPVSGATSAPRLRVVLEDAPAFRRAWLIDGAVPGPATVSEVPPAPAMTQPAHPDARFKAAIQRQHGAVHFEIRIPLHIGIEALYFEVLNTDTADGVAARMPRRDSLQVRFAPQQLARLLHSWAPTPGRRLRVIDAQARVVAQAGDVRRADESSTVSALLERLIAVQDERLLDLTPVTLKLTGDEVDAALRGQPMVRLRRTGAEGPLVVSAAWPLRSEGQSAGALILEESTSPAQALGRRALLELFIAAGGAFLFGTVVLLVLGARLVARLRTLRDQAADTIDESGRVLAAFSSPADKDEIGDLGRSFGSAVGRLQGYQDYLEQLAQRLSHELRTPLTVIRSSLDNLKMTVGADHDSPYIERAQAGVERLESIIRRMSEAARLEQAMSDNEKHDFDLVEVVRTVLPTWQQTCTEHSLVLDAPSGACTVNGSAELLVQALDKLISNARDFADVHSDIEIRITLTATKITVLVCNCGPPLPDGDAQKLFESMTSDRRESGAVQRDDESHLGLGLYVVRLVAQFHGGRALAREDIAARRVCMGLELPCSARR